MRNIRLDICYDGTRYQGWQRQSSTDQTIQGKLETALSRILEEPIEISGSGRTDAGTHARGQVASFHCKSELPCEEILAQLRRYLPGDIGIYSCKEASPRFHARLNATGKTYCYRVWNSDAPCVFDRRYVHILPEALNLQAMETAAKAFVGRHDFAAFCTNAGKKKSTVRTITSFTLERVGHEVRFWVSGDGFLHNQVRIMVGTLLEVGLGQREPDSIGALFDGARAMSGEKLPSRGLCLEEVQY